MPTPGVRTSSLLSEWDKGSRAKRLHMLTGFIRAHRNSTGAEIEKDLGPVSMLLFTRITAWLRLTYQLGYELSTQLNAIALFLQGQRFLTNFMEVGGVQTLEDLLCVQKLKPVDKQNALLILIHIANSGRVYREMICDGAGIDLLVESWLPSTDEQTLELYGGLFMALGQGNPRKSSLVHAGLVYTMHEGNEAAALTAATTLRSLQLAKQYYAVNRSNTNNQTTTFPSITNQHANRKVCSAGGTRPKLNVTEVPSSSSNAAGGGGGDPSYYNNHHRPPSAARDPEEEMSGNMLLDALFHLLQSQNIKLRFEGTSLLVIASQNPQLVSRIVNRMLDILEDDSFLDENDEDVGWTISAQQRQQAACARALSHIIVNDNNGSGPAAADKRGTTQKWVIIARDDVAKILENRSAHLTLLRLIRIADFKDIDTQRECLSVLQVITNAETHFQHMRTALQSVFGDYYDTLKYNKEFDMDLVKVLHQQVQDNKEFA
eukprot:TRINITY_DN2646_c0_g1_i1.p1 TRINITY_DN2646_c0_g1~~TRINITY_DN2646_c0_g1_i1.p1  ORF type:complete len:489 (-),score=54.29 TRINITY_DN2646_c0_g1_i1:331-1797(-)